MEKRIKFSVLMSVYKNDEDKNFEEAVNSVINQTFKPNEILIMVDGPVNIELNRVTET